MAFGSSPSDATPGAAFNGNFSYTANDEGVTVNGRHYPNMDAVPAADRARIEALQRDFGPDSEMMKQLMASGKHVSARTTTRSWSTKKGSKTVFTHETRGMPQPSERDLAHAEPAPASAPFGYATRIADPDASPGAVPRKGGTLGWGVLVVVLIIAGLAWLFRGTLGAF